MRSRGLRRRSRCRRVADSVAIRYADREYGEFDEVELEPYRRLSEEEPSSSELRSVRETVAGWLRSEP
jgi:hypothetical protein